MFLIVEKRGFVVMYFSSCFTLFSRCHHI